MPPGNRSSSCSTAAIGHRRRQPLRSAGRAPPDSPFLRRPDLLASLIAYWHNHPCLVPFLGPVHRSDQPAPAHRRSAQRFGVRDRSASGELEERLRRNAGPAHRSPLQASADRCEREHSPRGVLHRQALCARRAGRAPRPARAARLRCAAARPDVAHATASAAMPGRALLAAALSTREAQALGTELHDRFMLPWFVWQDFEDVIAETAAFGYPLERAGSRRTEALPCRRQRSRRAACRSTCALRSNPGTSWARKAAPALPCATRTLSVERLGIRRAASSTPRHARVQRPGRAAAADRQRRRIRRRALPAASRPRRCTRPSACTRL